MHRKTLRDLLERHGSLDAIRAVAASSDPGASLPSPFCEHIGDVYQRLEVAGGSEFADSAALRLAVLVHEEPHDRLPSIIEKAGFSDLAPTVLEVVKAFGRIWKIKNEEELGAYMSAHEHHLAAVLLFELAHEGQPIPAMEDAAKLGGLERSFTRWVGRLRSMTDAQPNPTLERTEADTAGVAVTSDKAQDGPFGGAEDEWD